MKSPELVINHINSICNTFHELYNLNWGGCCYMAYIIADYLEKNNIPFNVVIIDDSNYFDDWDNITRSVSHVSIKVKDTLINYSEDYNSYFKSSFPSISSKDLLSYYNKVSWCTIYSKAENSFLKSLFNKMMKHAVY